MALTTRVDLVVPYVEKEDAEALGARWDKDRKVWYAPPGIDPASMDRWLPKGFTPPEDGPAAIPADARKGMALIDLLAQVRTVIERDLPDTVWVRAEVSELRGKNGHFYLHLAERNELGDVLAQAKAVIWKSRAAEIAAKFERATGEGLRTDIKILCLARVRFDVLYGLDLIIEDVDPSYTLGDLAAKLARIRERLQNENLYEKNRGLPAPVEFVRVAVISPSTSAGLGDFRREADRLHGARLCDFIYYNATFQGSEAPSSIRTAVNEVFAAHRRRPFDALVVIRGGGSVTDLAWLNNLELSRLLCGSPLPIFTGIGHERDGTILDEVAHSRFDTPSKFAMHISATIRDNAVAAATAIDRINLQVARILTRERTALATLADRVESGLRAMTQQARDDRRKFMTIIRTATHYQLREASLGLEAGNARLIGLADQTVCGAAIDLDRSMEAISYRSELILAEQRATIEKEASIVALKAKAKAESAVRDLDHLKSQVDRDATRLVTNAAADLECDFESISGGVETLVRAARRELEASIRIIVGLGPQATLRRGFAIARDARGEPITSRRVAIENPEFTVQFHDGIVPVAVRISGEEVVDE